MVAAGGTGRASVGRDRDRDATGRARNARPRDALGRPLPRGDAGVPQVPDDMVLAPAEALAGAQRLIDEGQPFHAHEVLEAAWKSAPPDERDLWQGLAQVAVGLTHALRGNPRGAAALLRRGAARLAGYPPVGPHDVDVAGIGRHCEALAARISERGLMGVPEADLRVRLAIEPDR
jgi:uncharacterized protein